MGEGTPKMGREGRRFEGDTGGLPFRNEEAAVSAEVHANSPDVGVERQTHDPNQDVPAARDLVADGLNPGDHEMFEADDALRANPASFDTGSHIEERADSNI